MESAVRIHSELCLGSLNKVSSCHLALIRFFFSYDSLFSSSVLRYEITKQITKVILKSLSEILSISHISSSFCCWGYYWDTMVYLAVFIERLTSFAACSYLRPFDCSFADRWSDAYINVKMQRDVSNSIQSPSGSCRCLTIFHRF